MPAVAKTQPPGHPSLVRVNVFAVPEMSSFHTRCTLRSAIPSSLAFVLSALLTLALSGQERGLPLITVYPAETHKAGPQTFDVAQDSRGVLFFGNLHGLLSYDGAWWRLRKLPDEQAPLSMATDDKGRLALGLVNDLGYLAAEGNGSQEFQSLLPAVPQDKRQFGDVLDVCTTADGQFLFLTEKRVLVWNGSTVRSVAEFADRDSAPRGCLADKGGIYLRGIKGLSRLDLENARIEPPLLEGRVGIMLRGADGAIVATVRDKGVFSIKDGVTSPFAPAAGEWLKGKGVSGGCTLKDGRLVISTRENGLIILSPDGELEQIIGEDAGLPDAVLSEVYADREGALWLAMEGPLVRIDLASPVMVFDSRHGLRGSVGDAARFAGRLYAVSSHGLHHIDANGIAHRIAEAKDAPWRVLPFEDELLIGTSKGVYSMNPAGAITHPVEGEIEIYDLMRSESDRQRVWLAERNGISSIRKVNGKWLYEGVIEGTPQYISSVAEAAGVLWAGSVFDGVMRVDEPRGKRPRVQKYGTGEMNAFNVGGRIVLVDARGEILQAEPSGRLVPDALLGHIKTPRGFFVVVADKDRNVWINSTPPRFFERKPDGTYAREGRPLVSVTAADIQNVRIHDGLVWFAADKGLFRYEPSAAGESVATQPPPLIRRVVAGENRVLFGGQGGKETPPALKHNFGRIRIEFAPTSYRPGVSYQYRLDPIDDDWSEWIEEQFIDYTTLEASDYTFRLRARGPDMTPSSEARWSFTVEPPWYRTPWAYTLWAILLAAAIFAVISARTHSLHRQARTLRETVAERTTELQNTVKLLEEANIQLEALSLEDDLTGISNRRSFERALADEWNRARRRKHPLALILVDLDHFKDLNDHRGHPAGDACLRRIGGFLSETIRRSGEVVARYGGEEFAILLPGVDADVAIRVAELIRSGIEGLAIVYTPDKERRMTASCGVAAITPQEELTPESLVAAADRALYAAKHSGRNCVRLADDSTTGTWLRDASA